MAMKICSYKNCENYVVDNVPNGDFKMFQFPKDEARCKQWIELGKVANRVPHNKMFMCSDHFDRKYMSVNQRRTVLVGQAVPFPFNETSDNSDDEQQTAANAGTNSNDKLHLQNVYMIFGDEIEKVQRLSKDDDTSVENRDEVYQVESTMHEDKDDALMLHDPVEAIEEDEDRECDQEVLEEFTITDITLSREVDSSTSLPKQSNKRKYLDIAPAHTNVKDCQSKAKANTKQYYKNYSGKSQAKHSSLAQNSKRTQVYMESLNIDNSDLIDARNVTTFIFKGEEFVQMSKEHYVQEKMELLQRIKRYESVLKKFKQDINAISFS